MKTSTRASLNGHTSRMYLLNLKGPNWALSAGRAHFNVRCACMFDMLWFSIMELNSSDRGEGEVQPWESLQ